jgi:predicted component of type VI protein secretion system
LQNLFKFIIVITILNSCLIGQTQDIKIIKCAKTKQLALKQAKEELALKLAPKPKFNLNPNFSSFPIVVDDINLKVRIIKIYKDNLGNICIKIQKKQKRLN